MEKLPLGQLADMLASTRTKVTPGSRWLHYKGGEYIAKDIVLLEDSNEISVLYSPASQPDVSFVRPLGNWMETVDWNGQALQRFTPTA